MANLLPSSLNYLISVAIDRFVCYPGRVCFMTGESVGKELDLCGNAA